MNLDAVPFTPRAVLDIGANVGGFYHEAKAKWPDAEFLLIEGNPACQPMLELLAVPFYTRLLGKEDGVSGMWVRKDAPTCTGASSKRELTDFYAGDKASWVDLRVMRLDTLLEGRRQFDLIKIDTQGSELDIIEGGLETIAQAKGVILELSYEQYNEGAPLAKEVINRMAELGFFPHAALQHIVHPLKRHHIQDDMLFVKEH